MNSVLEAQAFLAAHGVEGVTITGGGEDWFVSVGFAAHERFVTAYSKRNPGTPNDPLYLAQQAYATLVRNERPWLLEKTEPLSSHVEHSPEPAYSSGDEGSDNRVALDELGGGLDDDGRPDLSGIPRDIPNDEFAEGFSGGEPSAATDLVADDQEDAGAFEADAIDADFTDSQWRQLDQGYDPFTPAPQSLAEITDPPALEFSEEMLEAEAQAEQSQQDRFYGLDDLDRRKTVAIGLVMRHAKALMPFWSTNEDAALAELRNFAMGVAEQRWADDAGRQAELGELEAARRRIGQIERVRDAKIEQIEASDREAFEAFDPEAGWPE